MKRLALLFALIAPVAASAQPAKNSGDIEQVIVTGERTMETETHAYVEQHVAPAPLLGKLARWNKRNPICPSASGFSPANAAYIVRRIKELAAEAGAPLSKKNPCRPNMAVIATTVPQGVMDAIHAQERSDLIGYDSSGSSRGDAQTMMKYPVQALYETATIDDNGNVLRDMILNPACPPPADYCMFASSGQRARDGIESAFYNVTIIVDARDIPDHPFGALADYFAMDGAVADGQFRSLPGARPASPRFCHAIAHLPAWRKLPAPPTSRI